MTLGRKKLKETKVAKTLQFDSIETELFISHNNFFEWDVTPSPLDRVSKIQGGSAPTMISE